MARIKYKFNPKSLSFERIRYSIRDYLKGAIRFLFAGLVVGAISVAIFLSLYKDPRLRIAERENEFLKTQIEHMNDELDTLSLFARDIQHKDDEVYRAIFGAPAFPDYLRKPGIGGADRYRMLKGYESSEGIIETKKRIARLQRLLVSQSKSFEELFALAKDKDKMLQSLPAIQPVSNKDLTRIASGFGMRIHPIYKIMKMHTGLDFTAPIGTDVYATGDGVVESADSKLSGYGVHIVINHGYGYQTLYGHLSKVLVRPGERIKRGQLIGQVGNSGISSGPHLHYEVWVNGQKVDPAYYFFSDIAIDQYEDLLQRAANANQSFD